MMYMGGASYFAQPDALKVVYIPPSLSLSLSLSHSLSLFPLSSFYLSLPPSPTLTPSFVLFLSLSFFLPLVSLSSFSLPLSSG